MLYRDWLNLKVNLLWCHNQPVASGHPDSGRVLRSENYTNAGAWLVREGWAQVEHDGECHRADSGEWLIVKPGPRVQSFSADARLISIAFEARWPDGSHLFHDGLSLVVDDPEKSLTLEKRVRPILNTMKQVNPDTWDARDHEVDFTLFLKLERLLCLWLSTLSDILRNDGIAHSGHGGVDPRVRAAIDQLQAADLGQPIDTEHLATLLQLSQNHLIRLFRRDLQTTPVQYWNRLRVEHARRRLLQPDAGVKQVALELGFTYLSHFSKWFKRHTGITPREATKKEG
ncbi:MAG: helix-turn-helix domain-containing protein [Verrucomicrobiae bacterium]|nr:helix-turn-helix domain-containing protein [Verrucomicrobiae bacterium]NNJ42471.1 helix-turn-helix domain-containing protein [Akkermansiaceae bacterium]